MVTIDLITGFLGSGKTTFIKHYAKYLMDQGMNIGILENDFGAVNAAGPIDFNIKEDHLRLQPGEKTHRIRQVIAFPGHFKAIVALNDFSKKLPYSAFILYYDYPDCHMLSFFFFCRPVRR